ncbi:tetratricopeptide repeat protein [Colwellia psychrerythraea]|uniref:Sel1 domain protein repeat-containing protein n=1 Tax=Colwellia psychrerythraea TaxID=28229 RepID=A0A099KMD5_COLPS|nr:sel1 repeat family protein [Colwellia psychrerythraea]KGJ91929.1 Sel1 domain protein repeat-containing protein [Colwellia psychrerythraea]
MDYRESTVSLGITDKLLCPCCGSQQHRVNSVITYSFYFFEYLPIFPVKRDTKVQCLQCQNLAEVTNNNSDRKLVFSDFSLAFFNKLRLLSTFTGSIIIILLLSYYFSEEQEKHRQSQAYIEAPKVNDFYYLDYRAASGDRRPNHKYRIAKIVDITGGTVSLTYGNYFYPLKRSLSDGVRFGHSRNFDYFEKQRQNFSLEELDNLFEQGFIYRVMRPELFSIGRNKAVYMIDGNAVTNTTLLKEKWFYIPGKRENTQGVAFLKASHIENSFEQAFTLLKQSAELGYAPGQTNLAELYLTFKDIEGDGDVENAAHWLFQAALQGYQPAIEKYRVICQLEEACDIEDFYRALNDAGTNLRIK